MNMPAWYEKSVTDLFVHKAQLTGNQQADDVKAGLGSFGSLKKDS